MENTEPTNKKVLLLLLPFWTPLIPPLGLTCLKAHVEPHGFDTKTIDANSKQEFWQLHHDYMDVLKKMIPKNKVGNFINVGDNVVRNHLMIHINKKDEKEYLELLKIIVQKQYYVDLEENQLLSLVALMDKFYSILHSFILDEVKSFNPDIVGLSVFTGNLAPSLFAFEMIKKINPAIKTIMGGGVFASDLATDTEDYDRFINKSENIDCIIIGEGEELFLRYIKGELESKKVYTISDLNNSKKFELKDAKLPDFSDLNLENYIYLSNYTSRSCPFQCSFCTETVHWGAYRKKTGVQIANELIEMRGKYNRQLFLFGDSLINIVVTDLSKELIARKESIYWDGYLRADPPVCDVKNTQLWRNGGMYRARLGVESGSDKMLKLMNKKISAEQIKNAIYSLASVGIKTTTLWLVGHPEETEEDFMDTLNLIEEMADFIYEAEISPFRYFISGQVESTVWNSNHGCEKLYPEKYDDLLMVQTYDLVGVEPSREVVYERLNRIRQHIEKLGIPNPYVLNEVIEADKRWALLHSNAVPSVLDLMSNNFVENIEISNSVIKNQSIVDEGEFNF